MGERGRAALSLPGARKRLTGSVMMSQEPGEAEESRKGGGVVVRERVGSGGSRPWLIARFCCEGELEDECGR